MRPERNEADSHSASVGEKAADSWVAGREVKPGRKKARQVCRPRGSQSYRVSRRSPLAAEAIAGKSGDRGAKVPMTLIFMGS
jgi:hypothetical protein